MKLISTNIRSPVKKKDRMEIKACDDNGQEKFSSYASG